MKAGRQSDIEPVEKVETAHLSRNYTEQAPVAPEDRDVGGSWLWVAGSGTTHSMSSYIRVLDLAVHRTGFAVEIAQRNLRQYPRKR
jgi:hypothetical protein